MLLTIDKSQCALEIYTYINIFTKMTYVYADFHCVPFLKPVQTLLTLKTCTYITFKYPQIDFTYKRLCGTLNMYST